MNTEVNSSKITADIIRNLSATQIVGKIKSGDFSSVELLDYYQQRYQKHNPHLNAIVVTNFEAARERALEADKALAQGKDWGPLHGLPMTIKDCYEVVGMPTTAGNPIYKNHRPESNADAVQKLLDAGAIVFGKTNVPFNASDLQSYNDIYGTTNNPWDISKSPGGSSGGAAAALASGMTPIELGSDLGGSIRTPSHYCGVFGHKPSHNIVSLQGHIPGPPGTQAPPGLSVAGPMARNPEDLELLLDILITPGSSFKGGWKVELPASQKKSLNDYKILAWFDDDIAPIDHEMRKQYGLLVEGLKNQGAQVDEGPPDNRSLEDFYVPYLKLLAGVIVNSMPKKERIGFTLAVPLLWLIGRFIDFPKLFLNVLKGLSQSHRVWKINHELSLQLLKDLQNVFDSYDIILMPVVPVTAIPHDHSADVPRRKITVNGEQRSYTELFPWISFATLLGLPATSIPIAVTDGGLPMNVQIVSNKFKDKETIQFAKLLHKLVGKIECPEFEQKTFS